MPEYMKFYVALVGGSATSVAAIWADTIAGKVAVVVLAGLTAAGVRQFRNGPADEAPDELTNQ